MAFIARETRHNWGRRRGTIYFLAGIAVLRIAEAGDPVFGFAFFGVVSIASNGVRFVRVAYRRIKRLDLVRLDMGTTGYRDDC